MPSRIRRNHARWPFWLLLAAWVCANTPAGAACALLGWIEQARHFSHQRKLTAHVVYLLAGEKLPAPAVTTPPVNSMPTPPLPPVSPEAMAKKVLFAPERTIAVLPPTLRADWPVGAVNLRDGTLRAPPPHGPPRMV